VSAVPDKEAWRYSERAWQALHSQEFVAADTHAELPKALAAQLGKFAWRGASRVVFVNGEPLSPGFPAEYRLRDGERLHFVFVSVPGVHPAQWQRDIAVTLEQGSAHIFEQHVAVAGADAFGELRSRVRLGRGARLSRTTISDLPDSVSLFRLEQLHIADDASFASTHALFGGRLQRFDLDTELEQRARYQSYGVFAPRARQHIDVHLDARHSARDSRSEVLWRGVADQRGRGILHGAIKVAAGADGTDAQLQTKNLLLSPYAEIDAQPVLEIYADEVKASHGATVGQLDERALFYLRSRGVPAAAARSMLIAGFCREAFERESDADLLEQLETVLAARLPQAGESQS
jgi:Fe-S cluster assembly protein SufD